MSDIEAEIKQDSEEIQKLTSQLKGFGFTQDEIEHTLKDEELARAYATARPKTPVMESLEQEEEEEEEEEEGVESEEQEIERLNALLHEKESLETPVVFPKSVFDAVSHFTKGKRTADQAGLVADMSEINNRVMNPVTFEEMPPELIGLNMKIHMEDDTDEMTYGELFDAIPERAQAKVRERKASERAARSLEMLKCCKEKNNFEMRVLLAVYAIHDFDWEFVVKNACIDVNIELLDVLYEMEVIPNGPNENWREFIATLPDFKAKGLVEFFDTIDFTEEEEKENKAKETTA